MISSTRDLVHWSYLIHSSTRQRLWGRSFFWFVVRPRRLLDLQSDNTLQQLGHGRIVVHESEVGNVGDEGAPEQALTFEGGTRESKDIGAGQEKVREDAVF